MFTNKKHKKYMLDTNTVSYLLKGTKNGVRKHLDCEPMENIFISVITEAELLYGLVKNPKAKSLHKLVESFLEHVEILPWDSLSSRTYASLRASTEAAGLTLGNLDLLIAAHALATEMTLVTSDRAFYRIKMLKLEDWTK